MTTTNNRHETTTTNNNKNNNNYNSWAVTTSSWEQWRRSTRERDETETKKRCEKLSAAVAIFSATLAGPVSWNFGIAVGLMIPHGTWRNLAQLSGSASPSHCPCTACPCHALMRCLTKKATLAFVNFLREFHSSFVCACVRVCGVRVCGCCCHF